MRCAVPWYWWILLLGPWISWKSFFLQLTSFFSLLLLSAPWHMPSPRSPCELPAVSRDNASACRARWSLPRKLLCALRCSEGCPPVTGSRSLLVRGSQPARISCAVTEPTSSVEPKKWVVLFFGGLRCGALVVGLVEEKFTGKLSILVGWVIE